VTGQELYEHVQELARDLDVEVWICATARGWNGEARLSSDGQRIIFLSGVPDEPGMYLVALHELGHHASSMKGWRRGYRLDREAAAWQWAIENMPCEPGPDEWAFIRAGLMTYAEDGRFKQTDAFLDLLDQATGWTSRTPRAT
jgi:hypothetical protein